MNPPPLLCHNADAANRIIALIREIIDIATAWRDGAELFVIGLIGQPTLCSSSRSMRRSDFSSIEVFALPRYSLKASFIMVW